MKIVKGCELAFSFVNSIMDCEFSASILTIGKQANPAKAFLRNAIIVWGGEDRSGDPYWWWLDCRRQSGSCIHLKLWSGAADPECEDCLRYVKEVSATGTADSWAKARGLLELWRGEFHLWLPDEILDSALVSQLQAIAPRLK